MQESKDIKDDTDLLTLRRKHTIEQHEQSEYICSHCEKKVIGKQLFSLSLPRDMVN
jgi:hypothetical protein